MDDFEKQLINEIDGIKTHGWLGPENMADIFTEYLCKYRAFKSAQKPMGIEVNSRMAGRFSLAASTFEAACEAGHSILYQAVNWVAMSRKHYEEITKKPTAPASLAMVENWVADLEKWVDDGIDMYKEGNSTYSGGALEVLRKLKWKLLNRTKPGNSVEDKDNG